MGTQPRQGDASGQTAEAEFESMIKALIDQRKLSWAQGVSKSPSSEDVTKKIDFRIRSFMHRDKSLCEFSIPIQVKASGRLGVLEFDNDANERVYVIIMYPGLPQQKLRKVLYKIYGKEVNRRKTLKQFA